MLLHSGASLHNRQHTAPDSTSKVMQPSRSASPALFETSSVSRRIPMFRFSSPYPGDAPVAAIPEESIDNSPPGSPVAVTSKKAKRTSLIELPVSNTGSTKKPVRQRPVSDYIPRNNNNVRFQEPGSLRSDDLSIPDEEDYHVRNYFTQSAPASGTNSINPSSEDDDGTYSEFSDNSSTMTGSVMGASRRRSKRLSKMGSRFIVAQPPPKVVKKSRRLIQIRPHLLLQIQLVTETRPKPMFDVLPSTFVSGSPIAAPRLARKFPRLFRMSGCLGANDLVLARSEDYGIDEDSEASEERLDRRDLIAVFSPVHDTGKTEIVLADGTVWSATPLGNGSYDFIHEAADGTSTRARWAKRKIDPTPTPGLANALGEEEPSYKFTFSILDPSTRRHPVMATAGPNFLEIQDFCYVPEPSAEHASPTPRASVARRESPSMFLNNDRRFIPIDPETRAFIAISSVWVSLQQKGITGATPPRRTSVRRSIGPAEKPQSPVSSSSSSSNSSPSSVPAALVSSTSTKRCSLPLAVQQEQASVPRRSMSTGAAYMHRRVAAAASASAVHDVPVIEQVAVAVAVQREIPVATSSLPASVSMPPTPATNEPKKGLFSSLKRVFSKRKSSR